MEKVKYNGYEFRTKIEAKWAIYFDELGIKYKYEPHDFLLTDLTAYLPSFYLPQFQCYVEVIGGCIENFDHGRTKQFVLDEKIPLVVLNTEPCLRYHEMMIPTEDDYLDVKNINMVADPTSKQPKLLEDYYLNGEPLFRQEGFEKAIEAVETARNFS